MRRREFIALVSGTAAAWPFLARGQQGQQDKRVRRVGYLSALAESDLEVQSSIRGLVQLLQELGWSNGVNVQFDFRFGEADAMRTSMLATELIELRPDVVFAAGAPAAIALRQHTLSIPIVFVQVVDSVAAGFVTNLARPEGNITGFTNFEFSVGGRGCHWLRNAPPVLTELQWFLIQPIRHGLHICARLSLPHHRSVCG